VWEPGPSPIVAGLSASYRPGVAPGAEEVPTFHATKPMPPHTANSAGSTLAGSLRASFDAAAGGSHPSLSPSGYALLWPLAFGADHQGDSATHVKAAGGGGIHSGASVSNSVPATLSGLPPLAGRRQGSLLVKPRGHWAQTDTAGGLEPAPPVVPSSRPSSASSGLSSQGRSSRPGSGRSSRPGSATRRLDSDPQWNGIRHVRPHRSPLSFAPPLRNPTLRESRADSTGNGTRAQKSENDSRRLSGDIPSDVPRQPVRSRPQSATPQDLRQALQVRMWSVWSPPANTAVLSVE